MLQSRAPGPLPRQRVCGNRTAARPGRSATMRRKLAREGGRMAKKKKIRVDLRKNRNTKPRDRQWTRGYQEHGDTDEAGAQGEGGRAQGELSRRRTIVQDDGAAPVAGEESAEMPAVDQAECRPGRVVRVYRDVCIVQDEDGREFRCAVRWLLRSLTIDERSIVT